MSKQPAIHISRRRRIEEFFKANIGVKFNSTKLHETFGGSFRSRKSDINKDPECPIMLKNELFYDEFNVAHSVYWAVWKPGKGPATPAGDESKLKQG